MIYALPATTFTATADGFATGLTGTIGVRIENADGTNHTVRTTAGIVELEPASGTYAKDDLVAPNTAGTYIVLWDDTTVFASEELVVTADLPVPPEQSPTGSYSHSFTFTPPRRFGTGIGAWVEVRIEESANDSTFTTVQTLALDGTQVVPSGLDLEPAAPQARNITTDVASLTAGWFRVVWIDGDGDESPPQRRRVI